MRILALSLLLLGCGHPEGPRLEVSGPEPPKEPSSLEGVSLWRDLPDLAKLNQSATRLGQRSNLPAWVIHSVPLAPELTTELSITYERLESPREATATLIQDGEADDSVRGRRYVLKFSREACPQCANGMSDWKLWAYEVTRRCWPGRGHEGYSTELCN